MKLNIKRGQAVLLGSIIVVAAFIGTTIYEQFELRGLRARVHTAENNLNNLGMVYDGNADNQKADYDEVSKEAKTVRVVDSSKMNYKTEMVPEPVYMNKKVIVYKVKVTNDTEWQHDYLEGNVKGKTSSGRLVDPVFVGDIHPDDAKGSGSLSLAPGGQGEVYVYLPADQGELELYFVDNGAV